MKDQVGPVFLEFSLGQDRIEGQGFRVPASNKGVTEALFVTHPPSKTSWRFARQFDINQNINKFIALKRRGVSPFGITRLHLLSVRIFNVFLKAQPGVDNPTLVMSK